MRTFTCFIMSLLISSAIISQDATGYQMPPKAIADLIDAPLTPGVSISPDDQWMLLLERPSMPSIEEVSQEELRLAGLRINPQTNGLSRSTYYTGFKLKNMHSQQEKTISGLPENPRLRSVGWSPQGSKIAFLNTVSNGNELWLIDVESATAKKLTAAVINSTMRGAYTWFSDDKRLIYKQIPADRGQKPAKPTAPKGPTIQSNEGDAAPVRTYQDMIRNAHDEALFAYYTTGQLMLLNLETGNATPLEKGIFRSVSTSPDGNYFMLTKIKKTILVHRTLLPFCLRNYHV